MEAAINLFLNGFAGVFAGMGVLYLAMKVNTVVARALAEKSEPPATPDRPEPPEKTA